MRAIYVGRVTVTADISSYAAQTDGAWKQLVDMRELRAPYQLMIEQTDIGTAVTTVALQAKLQLANRRHSTESIPSARWQDAEQGSTAIETVALTGAGAEKSNVLTEAGAEYARVLLKVTSSAWESGIYVDVWLLGGG